MTLPIDPVGLYESTDEKLTLTLENLWDAWQSVRERKTNVLRATNRDFLCWETAPSCDELALELGFRRFPHFNGVKL